jgi:hypothetical protein
VLALAGGITAALSSTFLMRRAIASSAAVFFACLALALAMPLPNWWCSVSPQMAHRLS